jgi:hypothetical protein
MITSPSRNGLVTGCIRLHKADVPENAVKVPTAPPAVTITGEKDLQTEEIFDSQYAGAICRGGR